MERNIPWTRTPRHKFDKAWPSGLTRSQNTIDFVTKCTAAYCKVHHGTPSKIGLQRSKTKGAPQLMKTWIVAPHFFGIQQGKGVPQQHRPWHDPPSFQVHGSKIILDNPYYYLLLTFFDSDAPACRYIAAACK